MYVDIEKIASIAYIAVAILWGISEQLTAQILTPWTQIKPAFQGYLCSHGFSTKKYQYSPSLVSVVQNNQLTKRQRKKATCV